MGDFTPLSPEKFGGLLLGLYHRPVLVAHDAAQRAEIEALREELAAAKEELRDAVQAYESMAASYEMVCLDVEKAERVVAVTEDALRHARIALEFYADPAHYTPDGKLWKAGGHDFERGAFAVEALRRVGEALTREAAPSEIPVEQRSKHPISEGQDSRDTLCWHEFTPGIVCIRDHGHEGACGDQERLGSLSLEQMEWARQIEAGEALSRVTATPSEPLSGGPAPEDGSGPVAVPTEEAS